MDVYLIPLIVLLLLATLMVPRLHRRPAYKVAAALFAAVACSVFAHQLWNDPAVALLFAVLIAVIAAWFWADALLGWILGKAWGGLTSWLRVPPEPGARGNAGPCPSCGFTYGWDGRCCSHCGRGGAADNQPLQRTGDGG